MYQEELFTNAFKGQSFLGDGCISKVYAVAQFPGFVLKVARRRDGTLNYLEWCQRMQKAGKGMKGMPDIDFITHTEEGYVVCMKRYSDHGFGTCSNEADAIWEIDYVKELIAAYDAYMHATFVSDAGSFCGDLHGGNIMLDGSTFVLLDPSARQYATENMIEGYTLQ